MPRIGITFTPLNLDMQAKTFYSDTNHLFRNDFIGMMPSDSLEKIFSRKNNLAGFDLEYFQHDIRITPLSMKSLVTVNMIPLLDNQKFFLFVGKTGLLKIDEEEFAITAFDF